MRQSCLAAYVAKSLVALVDLKASLVMVTQMLALPQDRRVQADYRQMLTLSIVSFLLSLLLSTSKSACRDKLSELESVAAQLVAALHRVLLPSINLLTGLWALALPWTSATTVLQ